MRNSTRTSLHQTNEDANYVTNLQSLQEQQQSQLHIDQSPTYKQIFNSVRTTVQTFFGKEQQNNFSIMPAASIILQNQQSLSFIRPSIHNDKENNQQYRLISTKPSYLSTNIELVDPIQSNILMNKRSTIISRPSEILLQTSIASKENQISSQKFCSINSFFYILTIMTLCVVIVTVAFIIHKFFFTNSKLTTITKALNSTLTIPRESS
ncbi:unnamed protein product [Didymodactylos carnosus]|uniref:Uncharacterized protein n=1 Tax=Didymodactylos carnosus TaxID=1234261 RepID=A0A813QVN4_9BILA|nr:unnamed protein product [Didymodactylos carnosus]CAF0873559.1 unnamed protein product [Didymodactylos carnosus]CAF3556105.1 unnamed protein product [Didymodactylos carnosus]CAF3658257.1 unnamed protein product [Didymodactylos carnosus]